MKTSEYLNFTSLQYSRHIVTSRAIPMITDGLKPSQRIAMHLLRTKEKAIKTFGLSGEMAASNLYVHGDASDTISRMAAPYINNYPLIKGEGTFGSRTHPIDGIGAPRYTEVRKSQFAVKELYVDHEICPQVENYDGSKTMPHTFLPRIPLVLLNGVTGIAIGHACKILPRSVEDVREAVLDVLKDGKTKRPLLPFYERYDCEVIRDHSNSSKYHLRGRVEIQNTSTVMITEIPPGMSLEKVTERLISLEEEKQIVSFEDNSTDTIAITVKMTREFLKNQTENQLVSLFKLVQAETENITVIGPDGNRVVIYRNVQDLIKDFVEWRLAIYTDRYERLLHDERADMLFWKSFLACFEPYDGNRSVAVSLSKIKTRAELTKSVSAAIEAQGLDLSNVVVERIVGMPMYRFTEEGKNDAKSRVKQNTANIKEYESILASPRKLKKVYVDEIQNKGK